LFVLPPFALLFLLFLFLSVFKKKRLVRITRIIIIGRRIAAVATAKPVAVDSVVAREERKENYHQQ
jgi:hypothetical protein